MMMMRAGTVGLCRAIRLVPSPHEDRRLLDGQLVRVRVRSKRIWSAPCVSIRLILKMRTRGGDP